ncbi:MAG: Ig-like domain-containing protein, partial [bacterium]|nr:Ig-like domain-containing protein [bacterium]
GTLNIYFTGWNRGTTAPSMGSLITHPDDKPNQITITYDPVIDCATDSCGGGWGDGWWRVVNWDVGMDEGGSSGGGLLDQNNLLVGVLTGGIGSDCNDFVWDEFAKIGPSWAGLKPHLDPDNSGAVSVPGKDGVSTGPGQASGPSPADGATDVALNAVLSWTAGAGADSHDVYFGTDPSPDSGEFQGNQAGTTFDPGPLANDTTYTWRIDEVNAQGTTTGQVWSFTTESEPGPPGSASNPSPADGATHVAVDAPVGWTAGSQADSHDVYFGTSPSPGAGEFQGNQTQTSFDPGTMANELTYYWRIDEVNALGTTGGATWSFTTELEAPPDVVTITKAEYKADKDEFKVESTSSEQPAAVLTVEDWGEMTWKNNKYELKIKPLAPLTAPSMVTVTSDLGGSDTAPVQGAPQPSVPGQAGDPSPGDGATGVSIETTLAWTAGSGTDSHDVYFGTSPSPGGGEFQGNQAGTGFDPGTLAHA